MSTNIVEGMTINTTQAAVYLGISTQTLRNWTKRGIIKAEVTATGRFLYKAEDLQALKKNYQPSEKPTEEGEDA